MPEFVVFLHGGWGTAQHVLLWACTAGLFASALRILFDARRGAICDRPNLSLVFGPWAKVAAFAQLGLPLIHWLLPAVHTALARVGVGILGLLVSFAAVAAGLVVLCAPVVLIMLGVELAEAAREHRRPFRGPPFPASELPPAAGREP
jgi:hypothetical protein